MKTIIGTLLFAATVIFTSCTGPIGPPGYDGIDGKDGIDGDSFIGVSKNIIGDFTPENDYKLYYAFEEDNITVYDDDVVLVYILWEQAETNDGGLINVWRLLPQTVVLNEGILQYNFDFTTSDVQIFLEGTVPFNTLLPAETDNQTFKIAVLPSLFAMDKSVDITDLNAIMNKLKINSNSIGNIKVDTNLIK